MSKNKIIEKIETEQMGKELRIRPRRHGSSPG